MIHLSLKRHPYHLYVDGRFSGMFSTAECAAHVAELRAMQWSPVSRCWVAHETEVRHVRHEAVLVGGGA